VSTRRATTAAFGAASVRRRCGVGAAFGAASVVGRTTAASRAGKVGPCRNATNWQGPTWAWLAQPAENTRLTRCNRCNCARPLPSVSRRLELGAGRVETARRCGSRLPSNCIGARRQPAPAPRRAALRINTRAPLSRTTPNWVAGRVDGCTCSPGAGPRPQAFGADAGRGKVARALTPSPVHGQGRPTPFSCASPALLHAAERETSRKNSTNCPFAGSPPKQA
jgi:hypothetical protein